MLTWAAERVPMASAILMLLPGPNWISAALKRSTSEGLYCWWLVVFSRASFSAAACARCAQASAMCCSRMWWEQDRLEGKVSGQYGHAFSFDPSIAIGGGGSVRLHEMDRDGAS